jgi:hypothetical protein
MRVVVASLVLGCTACSETRTPAAPVTVDPTRGAPVATPAGGPIGDDLPVARNVEPLGDDAPTVVVDRDHVLVDGAIVGDVHALESFGRLQKVDGVFEALKARREAWKAAHPAAPYPGIAFLKMGRTTKGFVAKSVFQTAAFSGHPYLAFVVANGAAPRGLARIDVDAAVPGPPDPSGARLPSEVVLHVRLAPGTAVVLTWRRGDDAVSEAEVPWREAFARSSAEVRAPALAWRFAREWLQQGAHRDPTDKKLDQAVLLVDDATELADVVAVLDALYEAKREIRTSTGAVRVPVFRVVLSMRTTLPPPEAPPARSGPSIAAGAPASTGRLAPEIIQRIVRGSFSKYRACYEASLGKDPDLRGRVSVRFVIGTDGKVARAEDAGSDLRDRGVVQCVLKAFTSLSFPSPEGGTVTVVYPLQLSPEDAPRSK